MAQAETKKALDRLLAQVQAATGREPALDRAVAEAFAGAEPAGEAPAYSASVDACLSLVAQRLPDWHWHIGHGPRGIMPYAVLSPTSGAEQPRFEALAPTVPLALLSVLLQAVRAGHGPAA